MCGSAAEEAAPCPFRPTYPAFSTLPKFGNLFGFYTHTPHPSPDSGRRKQKTRGEEKHHFGLLRPSSFPVHQDGVPLEVDQPYPDHQARTYIMRWHALAAVGGGFRGSPEVGCRTDRGRGTFLAPRLPPPLVQYIEAGSEVGHTTGERWAREERDFIHLLSNTFPFLFPSLSSPPGASGDGGGALFRFYIFHVLTSGLSFFGRSAARRRSAASRCA